MSVREDSALSITELTRMVKLKIEQTPALQQVWVRGEISNFNHHSSGHMYFTLKDKNSRIRCVMFSSRNKGLVFLPKDGSNVLARGNVSVYERDGQYQFYAFEMQPDGIGNLYLAFEQLKKKLESEGLFDQAKKLPIPQFPKSIGVVTSPTGAVVRDIIITLQRRFPAVPILLFPVSVQGQAAAPSICRAIEWMNEKNEVDVLIVGRGGGSLEELWAFNEESVARSIFHSRIPVISAVGHETDTTIADFTADLRAPTPTAAAELAVPHHMEWRQRLIEFRQRLHRGLFNQVSQKKERLNFVKQSTALTQPHRYLSEPIQKLDRLKEQLVFRAKQKVQTEQQRMLKVKHRLSSQHPGEQLRSVRNQLHTLQSQLMQMIQNKNVQARNTFLSHARQLDALSPLKVMQRGYSLVYDEAERKLIKSIAQVQPGDAVRVRLMDGSLDCQVWSMEEETKHGR